MEVRELIDKGFDIDKCFIPLSEVISSEEFAKPSKTSDGLGYRERAVARLIELRENWSSNCNLVYEAARLVMRIECPYCHAMMQDNGGGGGSNSATVAYHCVICDARVSITMPNDGVSVIPPKKEETSDGNRT